MPRDDYDRARNRDIQRRAESDSDWKDATEQRSRTFKRTFETDDFPAHTLHLQPDGSYLSDLMTFDVSRWNKK